jgi:hypothetical protein
MEPEPHYEDFRSLRRKIFEWEGAHHNRQFPSRQQEGRGAAQQRHVAHLCAPQQQHSWVGLSGAGGLHPHAAISSRSLTLPPDILTPAHNNTCLLPAWVCVPGCRRLVGSAAAGVSVSLFEACAGAGGQRTHHWRCTDLAVAPAQQRHPW